EGGNHLTKCIEQAGDANVQKLKTALDAFTNELGNKTSSSKAGLSWPIATIFIFVAFALGFLIAWKISH
ncbi:MAG: hypothetical protein VKJ04_12010, partial [Vampirovibrionales bacterium]|nr:hypothetical protein [Vampirovibrionales bacterium]